MFYPTRPTNIAVIRRMIKAELLGIQYRLALLKLRLFRLDLEAFLLDCPLPVPSLLLNIRGHFRHSKNPSAVGVAHK